MQKKTRKTSFSFGNMLVFMLLLLLLAGAVLLLIPQYREYRKKKQLETDKLREQAELQNLRNEQMQMNNDLRTSKEAPEKISREKFNQVEKDEIVIKYNMPERSK
jgi:cell division protein FtsB